MWGVRRKWLTEGYSARAQRRCLRDGGNNAAVDCKHRARAVQRLSSLSSLVFTLYSLSVIQSISQVTRTRCMLRTIEIWGYCDSNSHQQLDDGITHRSVTCFDAQLQLAYGHNNDKLNCRMCMEICRYVISLPCPAAVSALSDSNSTTPPPLQPNSSTADHVQQTHPTAAQQHCQTPDSRPHDAVDWLWSSRCRTLHRTVVGCVVRCGSPMWRRGG